MSTLFVIPTLFAAGFSKSAETQPSLTGLGSAQGKSGTLFEIFKQQHTITLAQHRSHSSHSSHSSHQSGSTSGHYSHTSHASHQSSTGGYDPYTSPAQPYSNPSTTPPPSSPRPSPTTTTSESLIGETLNMGTTASSTEKLQSLSGRTKRFAAIVRRVQIALLAQGVYNGPLNGAVGPQTRAALRKFQASRGLQATGTITPETLDALKVPSE